MGDEAVDTGTISDAGNGEVGNPSGPADGPHLDLHGQNIHSTIDDGMLDEQGAKGPDTGEKEKGTEEVAKTAEELAAEETAKGTAKEGPVPYERFKEVIDQRNTFQDQLSKVVEKLLAGEKPGTVDGKDKASTTEERLPYNDITTMEDEEILEQFQTNPKAFLANVYKQIDHEIRQGLQTEAKKAERVTAEQDLQNKIKQTFEGYFEKNPDAKEMWDKGPSGELQKFVRENPGHTMISAHQLLTSEKRIETARKEAAEEAKKEAAKNQRAKQSARTVTGGPAITPANPDDDMLKDTSKFGGKIGAIAERLRMSRQARGST